MSDIIQGIPVVLAVHARALHDQQDCVQAWRPVPAAARGLTEYIRSKAALPAYRWPSV